MTRVPSSRPNHITVYCDAPDLKYAEAFLAHYEDRLLKSTHNGQWLALHFNIDGIPLVDAVLILDRIKEELSKCLRRHRVPSTPPPAFPEKL